MIWKSNNKVLVTYIQKIIDLFKISINNFKNYHHQLLNELSLYE